MPQVSGHTVDPISGDHTLTLDNGREVKVPRHKDLIGAGWGTVLAFAQAKGIASEASAPAEAAPVIEFVEPAATPTKRKK